jgi:hypothetical protein
VRLLTAAISELPNGQLPDRIASRDECRVVGLHPFAPRASPVFGQRLRTETPAVPVVPGDLDTLRAWPRPRATSAPLFSSWESVTVPQRR